MKLEIDNLSFNYGKTEILKNIKLNLAPMTTAVIGPNGAGKSTLIKCVAGLLPSKGDVFLDGCRLGPSHKGFYTQLMSYLPQTAATYTSITVFETVLLGMISSLSLRVSEQELEKVDEVLKYLGIRDISQRRLNELSGGQQQMVYIAQAIIKAPRILLLDEPLNSLDIHHQFEILNILSDLTREQDIITVIAMHDLNLAARYADYVVVVNNGRIYSSGNPSAVITKQMIKEVYQVDAEVKADEDGITMIHFKPSTKKRTHQMGPIIQVPL